MFRVKGIQLPVKLRVHGAIYRFVCVGIKRIYWMYPASRWHDQIKECASSKCQIQINTDNIYIRALQIYLNTVIQISYYIVYMRYG